MLGIWRIGSACSELQGTGRRVQGTECGPWRGGVRALANCDNKKSDYRGKAFRREEGGFLVEEGFSYGLWAGDGNGHLWGAANSGGRAGSGEYPGGHSSSHDDGCRSG